MQRKVLGSWATAVAFSGMAAGFILMSGCGGAASIFDSITTGTNTSGSNSSSGSSGSNSGGSTGGGNTGGSASGGTNAGAACSTNTYTPNYAQTMADIAGKTFRLLFWPKFPISVVFVKDGNWTQAREDAVRAGFQRWVTATTTALGGPAVEFVDGNSLAEGEYGIKVRFVTQASLGGNTLGLTTTYFFNDRSIDHADMDIATSAPGGKINTASDLTAIAGHEMGHALGISGHSPVDTDQMYFAFNGTNQTEVTASDVNTLFTSYCATFARGRSFDRPTGPLNKMVIRCGH
jgi:predicted Zn-dependent protease